MNPRPMIAAFIAAIFACSCESAYETMRADPLPPTAFLPHPELLEPQKASFPFNRMWYDKGVDWNRFTKLKFAMIDTNHMLSDNWWEKVSEANATKMREDVPELASYMRSAFIKRIKYKTSNQLSVTEGIDEHTAVVQLAIVQLVPTKAFFNAVGTTVGFFIPGASLVNIANSGSVAMECRIIDGKTGKLILMLSDREKDEMAIIDLNGYTWYGHAKEIIDEWAKGFAELAVAKNSTNIKKDFPINIISL